MDALYNWHVKRFYDSKGYHRRFAKRLWAHRWSLWHVLKHLPETIAAARYFSSNKEQLGKGQTGIQAASASAGGLETLPQS